MIRQLGGDEIVIRSNWKAYLEDFSDAMKIAEDLVEDAQSYAAPTPDIIDSTQEAWTAFEQKYFDVGETTYELRITKV